LAARAYFVALALSSVSNTLILRERASSRSPLCARASEVDSASGRGAITDCRVSHSNSGPFPVTGSCRRSSRKSFQSMASRTGFGRTAAVPGIARGVHRSRRSTAPPRHRIGQRCPTRCRLERWCMSELRTSSVMGADAQGGSETAAGSSDADPYASRSA
jgi:hypothetical protein